VLAKYMRILTQNIVDKYEWKMINIHHSFLPAFIWANPYKQAYERWVKIIWATAHIVTKDLDEWPIISQWVKEVNHTDKSWRQLQEKWQSIEKNVLWEALKLMLEDRVFITWNKTIIL
jgi:formyltetrahydrofolate hydrolase